MTCVDADRAPMVVLAQSIQAETASTSHHHSPKVDIVLVGNLQLRVHVFKIPAQRDFFWSHALGQ